MPLLIARRHVPEMRKLADQLRSRALTENDITPALWRSPQSSSNSTPDTRRSYHLATHNATAFDCTSIRFDHVMPSAGVGRCLPGGGLRTGGLLPSASY